LKKLACLISNNFKQINLEKSQIFTDGEAESNGTGGVDAQVKTTIGSDFAVQIGEIWQCLMFWLDIGGKKMSQISELNRIKLTNEWSGWLLEGEHGQSSQEQD
jgi:hypothetical protein